MKSDFGKGIQKQLIYEKMDYSSSKKQKGLINCGLTRCGLVGGRGLIKGNGKDLERALLTFHNTTEGVGKFFKVPFNLKHLQGADNGIIAANDQFLDL